MGLFNNKNPNETAFTGGKKHWADVIKNTGPGELLIWRQPEEDFNTNSTLIVMPGEEAIFIKGGTVEQTFENGTYKLSTENYPFISRLRNAFTGGISTFNCVVYFVRKAHSEEILWGTDSPIQVRDKMLGIATKLKARGAYKVQIDNPVKFLEKLIGNNVPFQFQEELSKYFINEFQSKIKSSITRAANESTQELLGIEARLDEFADAISPFMQETLNDYGLKLVKFSIAAINIDDDELRRRYDEIGMDAIAKMRNAQADKSVMGILGDDWAKQQQVDILKGIANNEGGGVATAGAGLGMGLAAGGVFGGMAQQVFNPSQNQQPQNVSPVEKIKQLKEMLDIGAITQEEFDAKKKGNIKQNVRKEAFMKKTKIFWYLLDSIFLIVFNLYFFLLKGIEQPASVWISYASIHLAYLMLLITPSFVRKGSVSADYGRPLFVITTSYFFLALIVGVVFIALSPESITVALLVQVTIAAIFAILLLTNLIANEHTADNIERHEVELKYVKESSSKLDSLLKQISDNAISKKVEKAYDLIHSSQVKSSNNVRSIEQDVISEIENLEKALQKNNFENIQMIVDKICNLANERNRQLKLLN